jgi:hypothetical protein
LRYFLITFKRKAGGQIDEEASVVKNLRTSDIQTCNIILDFKERSVDRCLIEGKKMDTDWETIIEYYKKVYPTIIQNLEDLNKKGE